MPSYVLPASALLTLQPKTFAPILDDLGYGPPSQWSSSTDTSYSAPYGWLGVLKST